MGSAFIFDLMNIIGKTMDTLIKNGQWKEVNYTDCFNFTSTDMAAWNQATHFKQQILQASFKIKIYDVICCALDRLTLSRISVVTAHLFSV